MHRGSLEGSRSMRGFAARLARCARGALLAMSGFAAVMPAEAALRELAAPTGPVVASAPVIAPIETPDGRRGARFELRLSQAVDREVFSLVGPDRLAVDLPEVEWRVIGAGSAPSLELYGSGVASMRVGLFRPGRSRIVLDLEGAATDITHRLVADDAGARLIVEFFVMSDAPMRRAATLGPVPLALAAVPRRGLAPDFAARPTPRPKPVVVVIDPGHGGRDPGARHGDVREKDVVLTLAKLVERVLERPGRIEVVLTRETDVFLRLEQRVEIARAAGADLFVSLHADSLPDHPEVGGASVYTISDRASDRLAAELARSENAAERLGGVADAPAAGDLRDIVVDYRRRQVTDESWRFAEILIGELAQRVEVLDKRPHRQAGFFVLRNFNAPSVLVELGFITNLKDRRRLESPAWQENAAVSIARSVQRWLEREREATPVATATTRSSTRSASASGSP